MPASNAVRLRVDNRSGVESKVFRALYLIPVLGMTAVLPACTHPAVAPKPFAVQERENTVRDWVTVGRAIADSMAARGLLTARMPHPVVGPPVPPGRYYVNLIRPGIPFLQEVAEALKTEILARGSAVSITPADSMVVNLDVTSVRWSKDLGLPDGAYTFAGLAGGGAEVLNANGPYSPAAYFGMAAGVGLALDFIRTLSPRTNVEAVWKASIIQGDSYLMEASAPVYVRAGDLWWLYRGPDTNRMMASYELKQERSLVQLRYSQ